MMLPSGRSVLITAASAAWGTRITAAGESRAELRLYGSAATIASGALLQSRKRAYAEPVRSAPAAAVTTPPVNTPTMSARESQARQRRRASARRNSQTAVTETTAGPGDPQAGVQGEPHCAHVPIPAARGWAVNDAGILAVVVLPAQGDPGWPPVNRHPRPEADADHTP